MDIYLRHLIAAFNLVESKYFSSWAFTDYNEDKLKRVRYQQYIERVFAYELYHQFRLIISKNEDIYKGLKLNGEVKKNGFSKTLILKNHIYPDLVLHKDQDDNDSEHQKLFIEIKADPNLKYIGIKKDIEKLAVAVNERLNFQNAVFICVNYNSETKKIIKKIVTKKRETYNEVTLMKMWFLSVNGIENFIEIIK